MEGCNIKGFTSLIRLIVKGYLKLQKLKKEKPKSEGSAMLPPEWMEKQPVKPKTPSQQQNKPPIQIIEVRLPEIHLPKIRIPYLLPAKRYLAGILFLLNLVLALTPLIFPIPQAEPLTIFFLLNAFILLDYLWKTRRR